MTHPLEILLTSPVAGFDVLSAAILAQKLYPSATVVAPKRLRPGAKAFLALHKDRFPLVDADDVDFAHARRVVLVGLRRERELASWQRLLWRIQSGDPELDLHLVDQRAASPDDVDAAVAMVEPVASLVTLVVDALRERDRAVDVEEATLGALGLHERTRSLTAAATTGRDAEALAWLLDQGASLRVLNRYLRPAFKVAQRSLIAKLLGRFDLETVRGVDVGIASVPLERPVEGIVDVLEEVLRLEAFDAIFTIHACEEGVLVAGASRTTQVDVGRALAPLGAELATPQRGSLLSRSRSAAELRDALWRAVVAQPTTRLLVRDVMSSPVRCVTPTVSLRLLRDSLATWRHHGVPVVEDGVLVGVVSRRDIERAARDGALGERVRAYMARDVKTIAPEATLEEALEVMTRADVGRLPVLRERRIVGIVSRADVLRKLYAHGRGGDAK